jgi:hypothetical protein
MSLEDEHRGATMAFAYYGSYVMAMAFDADIIQLLAGIEEVAIETRTGPNAPAHRVTIWVVVDGGAAYVRSVRGVRGRWYREATAFPEVVVYAGERRLPARVEPVSDPTTIARVSEAFVHKYPQWPNDARAMVRDEVLATTLRLHPA